MILGILVIVLGVMALSASVLTSFVSIFYLGIALLVAGVLEVVAAFRARHRQAFLVYLLAGILTTVVGAMFLKWPVSSLSTLTLFIAGYMFTVGLFRGISSIADRYPGWGWDFTYALIAIALATYIVGSLPISAMWLIGTIVSVEIIARGIALVAASWALHDLNTRFVSVG